MKPVVALVFLSMLTIPTIVQAQSPLDEVKQAIEQQRSKYRAIAAKYQVVANRHQRVERDYAAAQIAVRACKRKDWFGIFEGTFEALSKRVAELDAKRKDINNKFTTSYVVLSNEDVNVKILNSSFAPDNRGLEYYKQLGPITGRIMEKYYAPMVDVIVSYEDYQKAFTEISTSMNAAAADCRKAVPREAVKKLVAKVNVVDALIEAIKKRFLP